MPTPANKISQVKLPTETVYDIVPTMMTDTNKSLIAKLPTLTKDSTIAITTDIKDATLTITQNSTSVGTFTANASSNATVNIETPQVKRYI